MYHIYRITYMSAVQNNLSLATPVQLEKGRDKQ